MILFLNMSRDRVMIMPIIFLLPSLLYAWKAPIDNSKVSRVAIISSGSENLLTLELDAYMEVCGDGMPAYTPDMDVFEGGRWRHLLLKPPGGLNAPSRPSYPLAGCRVIRCERIKGTLKVPFQAFLDTSGGPLNYTPLVLKGREIMLDLPYFIDEWCSGDGERVARQVVKVE